MVIDNTYDVIVVGGGIAGLTSSAYLSKNGCSTLLCEKSEKLGGLVNSFNDEGFTFDGGIRAFENSGIVFPMLKQLGIDIEFVKNAVSIGIEDKIIKLVDRRSLSSYKGLLNSKFPDNRDDIKAIVKEIEKVMEYMDVLYGIDNPLFMDITKDKEYIFKTLLPWLVKYQINIRKVKKLSEPIEIYLKKFTDNQALIDIIAQHFFKKTPAFFALSYFGLYLDYSYPKGGTGVLIEKLLDFIVEMGGVVSANTEVIRIEPLKKEITTADGRTFAYKELIWCADMKTMYSSMAVDGLEGLKDEGVFEKVGHQKALIESNHGGDSILTLYIEVDLDNSYFENLSGCHCFYTAQKDGIDSIYSKNWESIIDDDQLSPDLKKQALKEWIIEYLSLTTYEISCPALRDSSLAPIGQTGIIVSTLMDYRLVRYISDIGDYDEFKIYCKDKITNVLDKTIFPGISSRIIKDICSTPLTIERATGNSGGAITGWAFTGDELPAENRFQKIARSILTPVPNIYQAGQWSFSPSGLPVSILTGKLAADAICKKLN